MKKVDYKDLNNKQKENYNFHKVASILAEYGYNCIRLTDDWNGADFLAYHVTGEETLKVQQKGRVGIYKKYIGKNLYMTFPIKKEWYLIKHSTLIEIVRNEMNWLNTESWNGERGAYMNKNPSKKLIKLLEEYKL